VVGIFGKVVEFKIEYKRGYKVERFDIVYPLHNNNLDLVELYYDSDYKVPKFDEIKDPTK
jgi:hypothetical protein